MFFALSILFFVIFLLKPLSALSRDFVSYSVVVACNYVITSTSILFKALFHSQFVNNWRKSLTETFLLNFLSFFNVRSCPSSHFLTLYVRVCCEVWTANLYWSSRRGAYIYIYIYTASDTSQSFSFIYHSEYDPNTAKKANYNLKQVEKPRKKESRAWRCLHRRGP